MELRRRIIPIMYAFALVFTMLSAQPQAIQAEILGLEPDSPENVEMLQQPLDDLDGEIEEAISEKVMPGAVVLIARMEKSLNMTHTAMRRVMLMMILLKWTSPLKCMRTLFLIWLPYRSCLQRLLSCNYGIKDILIWTMLLLITCRNMIQRKKMRLQLNSYSLIHQVKRRDRHNRFMI